jgi:hypothetical protein
MSVRFEVALHLADAVEMTVPIECEPDQIGLKVRDIVELNRSVQRLEVSMNGRDVMRLDEMDLEGLRRPVQ